MGGGWSGHSARGHAGTGNFPWGTGIWNNERKDAASRLAEVLPSPTTANAGGNSFFPSDGALPVQTSPGPRDPGMNSQIPFAIPLHPTPKTYRSQSYSVGQLDPDTAPPMITAATAMAGRGRPMGLSGLQHRPSRPSMLSEMSDGGGMLGKVKETEDDDEGSAHDSLQGTQQQAVDAETIKMLTRENALLRQQAANATTASFHARLRGRASTAGGYGMGNGYGLHESVPEESDFAIEELEETADAGELAAKRAAIGRRMSEFGAGTSFRSPFPVENRKLENVKKAYWQTSLGFGGVGDVSQSRRHSFADVPTRQPSIGSIGEAAFTHEPGHLENQSSQEFASPYGDNSNANPMASYFTGASGIPGPQQPMMGMGYNNNPYASPYGGSTAFANRPTSPHRPMYGMSQPNRATPLHVVLFKCARADVFYIQEGTGLTVKAGDLVIVEADRGTDLGTIAVPGVDWAEAKRLKEHYAEEQYKWLMMYSQSAGSQDGGAPGLMATSNILQGSAVGGMGPPGQHHMQEPSGGELKPKLIKRLAQTHEIQALREKEGNEAKAKRVCMQKVKEHGLNMEILDAEFQMDWKKLTFYYFADAYINFNSLVTDLFKIYKTRIWMSAINPASFANQPLGLQSPSGVGPGAVLPSFPSSASRTPGNPRPAQFQEPQQGLLNQPSAGLGRGVTASAGYGAPNFQYDQPYASFGSIPRGPAAPFSGGMMPPADGFQSRYPQPGAFAAPQAGAPQDLGIDWGLQGLSLNSR